MPFTTLLFDPLIHVNPFLQRLSFPLHQPFIHIRPSTSSVPSPSVPARKKCAKGKQTLKNLRDLDRILSHEETSTIPCFLLPKKYLSQFVTSINVAFSFTHILHVHFELSPVAILVSPREKLRFTIYPPPFAPRPLRRCGPVQPWSLVNQRIAVPTNSSRFQPQRNNQGGQGRMYP